MKKLALFVCVFLLSSSAFAIKVVKNGGDTVALEFLQIADSLYQNIRWGGVTWAKADDFKYAVRETIVESTNEDLFIDGIPKDAINYPGEKRIVFNRQRWAQMERLSKYILVLHEYLGILGIDDSTYELSRSYISKFEYRRSLSEVDGPFIVGCKDSMYEINAQVSIESYGNEMMSFDPAEEKLRLILRYSGISRSFPISVRGTLVSAARFDSLFTGWLILYILRPASEDRSWQNRSYKIKDYLIHFENDSCFGFPERMNLSVNGGEA